MKSGLLATAKIGKTHGVSGFLRLYSLSGEYSHIKKLSSCYTDIPGKGMKKLDVESTREEGDLFLIRFARYSTPEMARLLSGQIMYIDRKDGPELEDGEFYIADLFGLDVIVDGMKKGEVAAVSDGAQAPLLHIRREDGKIFLVPYLEVYLSHPDFENGKIELKMPALIE